MTLAKDAGMKYIVITSKHHDGFALFKSQASRYNVVDATPFKRGVLKELADAAARQGIRLGFSYSQSQDWHEPNGAGNEWDFQADDRKDYDQYLRGKAEPQVKELLTGYGPVAHGLEIAGANHVQADRHRQQGRQLPAQRRADGRGHHPAAEPGHPAGRTLLDIERPLLDPMATVIVVEFEGTTVERNFVKRARPFFGLLTERELWLLPERIVMRSLPPIMIFENAMGVES